jgi:hypothetical protein
MIWLMPRWILCPTVLLLGLLSALIAEAQTQRLIPRGDLWRLAKGTTEASSPDPTGWRAIGFNDAAWSAATLPVFYGEPLTGTELTDMQNRYSTVFLRRSFTVGSPANVRSLILRVKVDDGFIAWINGREVARFGAPEGDFALNSFASVTAAEPVDFADYAVALPKEVLKSGTNVLAIQAFNATLASSDLVLDAELESEMDTQAPRIARILPAEGSVVEPFSSVEVLFDEPVRGVDASDLKINGLPAQSVVAVAPDQYLFSFPTTPVGTVGFQFVPGHGITDLSSAGLPFAGATWSVTVEGGTEAKGVLINEFLAVNSRGLRDEDGDNSDWIELFNSGNLLASMQGWVLVAGTDRWVFPSLFLAPNGRLRVFASGKNRTNDTARLHTSFRLSSAGERLALLNAQGVVQDEYAPTYPPQRADVSYGHAEGAPNRNGYFVAPTPGAPNGAKGDGFAPEVEFSVSSGTYSGALEVQLSPSTNAPVPVRTVIRYTVDGSMPTETSPVYSTPLRFTNLAVRLRARAFTGGLLPGELRGETYLPLTTTLANFRSDLPVMLIHDFGQGRPPANTRVFAHMQLYEPDTNGVTRLTRAPALATRAGISVRGSSTEGIPKASYRVEFRDEFDNDRPLSPLGMPADGDWVMYAPNFFEPVLIHNPFMHQLSRDIGRYSPNCRFVEVYFVGSGTGAIDSSSYAGIYVLMDRVEVGKHRVDAGTLEPENLTLPSLSGGYLMKIDRLDPGDAGIFAANQSVALVDPREDQLRLPARAAQLNYIRNYLTSFGNALYDNARFTNPVTGFRAYIDTGSWVDHHLLNVLSFNVDALRLSAFFYKKREGKIHFGPIWDFDRTLGSTDGRDSNPRVWRSQSGDLGTDFFNYPWWDRVFRDPDFYQEYIDRYQDLRTRQFATTNLWRLIDDLTRQVRSAQPREQNRWGVFPRGGTYQAEVNLMKAWISNRADFMDRQFVSPPRLASPSSRVASGFGAEIIAPSGLTTSVYYTTDGSDPRWPGGRTNPAARRYMGSPITLEANAKLVARSVNPFHSALTGPNNPPLKSTWSGRVSATYVVKPIPLVVSEIHFHPDDGGAPGDADNLEFVELWNRGDSPVSLAGMRLRGGIDFTWSLTNAPTLAPNAYGVLVRNLARFSVANLTVTNLIGEYGSDQLSNDGERLALSGPLDEPVFDFRYEASWEPLADGGGYSLVLANPSSPGDPALAASWKRSARLGGSPGVPDPNTAEESVRVVAERDATGIRFRFDAAAGSSHRLEERVSLSEGDWTPLNTWPAATPTRAEEFRVETSGTTRFFRVRRF